MPWRLQIYSVVATLYQTNVKTSYEAGLYKAMMDNAGSRPYWQYWTVGDTRVRDSHARLNGLVFPYDDPFWNYFYPSNGWRCRCKVRALKERQVKKKGLKVSSSNGKISFKKELVSKKSGIKKDMAVYDMGKVKISPSVGWSYNPGKSNWEPELEKYTSEFRKLFREDKMKKAQVRTAISLT